MNKKRKIDLVARPDEHPFAQYIRVIGKGKKGSRSFSYDEAVDAMTMVFNGQVTDFQLGAMLALLRVNEESPEELAGFVTAARNHIQAPTSIAVDLDWSSYAGKRRQLPWYLLAALCLADSGLRVFMHGAKGHTAGRIYSEDVLAYLGIDAATDWQQVGSQLDSDNFAFMSLQTLCPPLQRIIELRNVMGLRTPVHTLSRLLNPLAADYSLQSIFHPAYGPSHQRAAQILRQKHALVIKGEAGEFERKPDASCALLSVDDSQLSEQSWPRLTEERMPKLESLDVDRLAAVWHGEHDSYGEKAILGTIALVLHQLGKADDHQQAYRLAETYWQQRNPNRIKQDG
ncbi:Anthranilate phosphoribosyltransferase [Sinobacterium norvegicum]|uniref:Anthranilate phosphoribosyltransferase n=1 Tax=Sinobacterium norvegicum TaxID=1641715 RepID=A0ABM9AA47_9GAMM|nr:glycosyl transferase family protein [Sinobacterium norvegicum]CAH0990107.1 Anthranilate phosphoribosyltransferase [Sinobacterium norvegicum]